MNNRTVAREFARGEKSRGTGSHMYFEGNTIYSYGEHFPIAFKTDKEYNGHKIVIFNDNEYSSSTGRHKSYTHQALHDYCVIHTQGIKDVMGYGMTQKIRKAIKEELEKKIENLQAKEQRARKAYIKELYREDIAAIQEEKEVLRFV